MFKLPALPSPRAEVHELADFAEILAWHRDSVSIREIQAFLGREGENYFNEGVDDEDDKNAEALDEVMNEIDRRSRICPEGYPFQLDLKGTVLRHTEVADDSKSTVYKYLLLSTRLNMNTNKVQNGIDGTALLEELSALVLRCYLGRHRAKSFVFGTAVAGGFIGKVNKLCVDLAEGGSFSNIDPIQPDANDDKLDAVAWIPFRDERSGKLVIFCQCKTGSNWREHTTQLQPDAFLRRWTKDRGFALNPIRAFCISESPHPSQWGGHVVYAGLLFDRLRLVDFLEAVEDELISRVRTWLNGAFPASAVGV